MPYYVIPVEERERVEQRHKNFVCTMLDYPLFESRQLAHEAKTPDTVVVFLQSDSEQRAWHQREYQRFNDGIYQRVPELWHHRHRIGGYYNAFLHRSVKQPGMVAFTKDDEAGHLDRQTVMKPGRYLEEFHKGQFTAEQVAQFVMNVTADADTSLNIARSVDDIRAIYNAVGTGFTSCMQRKTPERREYDWQQAMDTGSIDHPAVVYADCDLGVAYRGPLSCVLQRAVVWPDRKQYVRIYGDGTLGQLLERAGYTKVTAFQGARIRRISTPDGGFLMPYLDSELDVSVDPNDPNYWIIGATEPHGRVYDPQVLTGAIIVNPWREDDADDDDVESWSCANCGDDYNYDSPDNSTDTHCHDCESHRSYCEHCESDIFHQGTTTVNGAQWCDDCIEASAYHCIDCEEWFDISQFSSSQRRSRQVHELDERCSTCADNYTYCDTCEAPYVTDDQDSCPTCEREPRCEATGDLLATIPSAPLVNSATDESPF